MGNVLSNISDDNTRFTIFEHNQVLTADHLNDLFNYLDVQSRLTRTRAVGIGIICGLEIGQLEDGHVVVSKGTAITTDGDLLHFDDDVEFDLFEAYEDGNARYSYFRAANGSVIPMYELRSSESLNASGQLLSGFQQATGNALKDHVGILYQEDYTNDPDDCTGTDCDNKGAQSVRLLKVLLVHKDNMRGLLSTMPVINRNYFSLDEVAIPRININTTIDTYPELTAAFGNTLSAKEDIKNKLSKAYQVCRLMLIEEFGNLDPTTAWNSLLDEHFKLSAGLYGQYVHDLARDLGFAYNELRETLFADNMICCPDVELFPKHVLMGMVKTAAIDAPVESPVRPGTVLNTGVLTNLNFLKKINGNIRFDIGSLIRRFHPIHIDIEYRHQFYESPVLNNKEENVRQTRFCFQRINAMIRNFRIPNSTDVGELQQGLRITPSHFEERPLGDRSIPFYYKLDNNVPLHLYWNFNANIRKRETSILSYFAASYSANPAIVTPLRYNILPYHFFRVEGHIGFPYAEVEKALNNLILEHNLPINVVTVQVESTRATIPRKDWYFPDLHLYEHFVRNAFSDHLDQVELVHNGLRDSLDEKIRTSTNAEEIATFQTKRTNIMDSANSFNIAKKAVLLHTPVTQEASKPNTDFRQVAASFKTDVENLIGKTTEIKRQTKDFAFSNTAIPHDFVINTDITKKIDLFADLTEQKVNKKLDDFVLANFIKKNPGLEHAGGVLRGGTFVLVYRSQDGIVVADFMLPYASVDTDVVANPPRPTVTNNPPPLVKKFDPKVIEIEPPYIKAFNNKIGIFDTKVAMYDSKINLFNSKIEGMDSKIGGIDNRVGGLDFKVGSIPAQGGGTGTGNNPDINTRFEELNNRFTGFNTRLDDMSLLVNGVDTKVGNQALQIGQFNSQLNTYTNKLAEFETRNTTFETRLNGQDGKLGEMDNKISGIDNNVKGIGTRVTGIDAEIGALQTKVGGLDTRLIGIDTRVLTLNTNMTGINTQLGSLNTKLETSGGAITRGGIIRG